MFKPLNKMFIQSLISSKYLSLSNATASDSIWDKSLEIGIAFGVKSIVCSILVLFVKMRIIIS